MGMDCEVSNVTAVKIGHKIEVDLTDVKVPWFGQYLWVAYSLYIKGSTSSHWTLSLVILCIVG